MRLENRKSAGELLSAKLNKFKGAVNTVVLGLPRGGVVVAKAVADKLSLPLDIIAVRKIGAPFEKELSIGAIAEDGQQVLNQELIASYKINNEYINEEIKKEMDEMNRRLSLYRQNRADLDLQGKTAIIVDDGAATGYTLMAAIKSVRVKKVSKVVVAIPVIAADTAKKIDKLSDNLVFLDNPRFFGSVGSFYRKFDQVEDEEVQKIMKKNTPVV